MHHLWMEAVGVAAIAFGGLWTGVLFSRRGRTAGLWVCALAVAMTFLLGAVRWSMGSSDGIAFALAGGRVKFVILSFVIPMGLAAVQPYLPYRAERWAVVCLTGAAMALLGVIPCLGTAMAATRLAAAVSYFDADGVCRQSTAFTCGPAAAATALRRLGVEVSEGRLAGLSRSCPFIGTAEYDLYWGIQAAAGERVRCRYVRGRVLPELAGGEVMLVMMPQSRVMNHCVAVVAMTAAAVVVADPSEGLLTLPREYLEEHWTGSAIVMSKLRTQEHKN
ncbi:cysteine peptidase family C39 domain-containing protein, partial [Anaerohalosphaeraceae bacterium U12dextr]